MKTHLLLFAAMLLAILMPLHGQNTFDAQITYINNEGFMISNNNKKLFIDALYNYGSGSGIPDAEPYLREMIMQGQEPFDNSELFLITHNHPDHFHFAMAKSYLQNHPNSTFVADSSCVKVLMDYKEQIFSPNPAQYEKVDTIINGFPLTAFNLLHDTGYRTYNMGYLVDVDGLRIFHTGDNTMEDPEEYLKFGLDTIPIDVAFVYHHILLRSNSTAQFIKEHFNAKYIVLIHVPENQIEATRTKVANLGDGFPPIYVFEKSMEKLSLTDTMVFTNHMPQAIADINDSSFFVNDAVSIQIPELFADSDEGDEISYSVSGLPAGLEFNSDEMIISGTLEKEGKSNVKVTGTDNGYCANSITFKLTADTKTAVNVVDINNLKIYPNPAHDILYIDGAAEKNITVDILDCSGRKIASKYVSDNQLNISKLTNGVYLLVLKGETENSYFRFVKN